MTSPAKPAASRWSKPARRTSSAADVRFRSRPASARRPSNRRACPVCRRGDRLVQSGGDHAMTTLDENFLALGSCIAGIGILMAGLLALLFRHPNAPRWTRPEIVATLLCVPVTATIGFGLAYTTYGLSHL